MSAKAFSVAAWEFGEKVKSKAFLISLVLMPVIIVAFGVLPGLLASKPDDKPVAIGVIDGTGELTAPLAGRLDEKYRLENGEPNYVLRPIEGHGDLASAKSDANAMVAKGTIEGYFYIPLVAFDSGKVEYRAENVGNFRIQERFSTVLEDIIMEKRLQDQGLNPALVKKLKTNVDVKSIKVSEKGEERESGFLETFFSAYIVIMMLLFLVMTSGQLLIRSVVEEKSNRVIEVLLSSCSARELMVGKILGLSGLGILQMLVWGLIGLAVSMKTSTAVFTPEYLLLSVVYFVLGYLLYSAIFVALGSPVTTEQEAQQLTSYLTLLLVFPIAFALPVMQHPDSLLIKLFSFFPLLTPTIMVLRIPIQMPALWEIVGTIAVLIVSTIVMMWAAGKIFRTAILVYGKRPTIPELISWLRRA